MAPRIDHEKCIICGRCIFLCGCYVFELRPKDDRVVPAKAKKCIDCFMCALSCPKGAIKVSRARR